MTTLSDAASSGAVSRAAPRPVTVYVTVGSEDQAKRIGRALVEERLVACANFHPIGSVYRWQDQVEEATEVALWLKTTDDRVRAVVPRIVELHDYEVPCVEVLSVTDAHAPFYQWVVAATRGAGD